MTALRFSQSRKHGAVPFNPRRRSGTALSRLASIFVTRASRPHVRPSHLVERAHLLRRVADDTFTTVDQMRPCAAWAT
jgi:hypothetical protein